MTNGKMKANLDGDFVIFLLGMRFKSNEALRQHGYSHSIVTQNKTLAT